MSREELISKLNVYQTRFPEEQSFVAKFIQLLTHPRAYFRDHLPGHMTGSAWIIDATGNFVLLTHHAKLNRWLQPGGHADGEEDISLVALKEAREETGLTTFERLSDRIFDIDIHTIPARKDFPEHLHYDVRILLRAEQHEKLTITEESHDLAWIHIDNLGEKTGNNPSMLRMAEKTQNYRRRVI